MYVIQTILESCCVQDMGEHPMLLYKAAPGESDITKLAENTYSFEMYST